MSDLELTILMPYLNEEETLKVCIEKALNFLKTNNVSGEVLIADNGSTDSSKAIAENCGARVIDVPAKGYGSALRAGMISSNGKYVIMGDSDDSYDFSDLMPFLTKLREGYDLVMGDRFAGGIEKGAMPFSHKYIGNPLLSFIGRLLFGSDIHDWHCGLRGYNVKTMKKIDPHSPGMEYASEMILRSIVNGIKITQVPTTLSKDGRSGRPHLRMIRDGWRHLSLLVSSRMHIDDLKIQNMTDKNE